MLHPMVYYSDDSSFLGNGTLLIKYFGNAQKLCEVVRFVTTCNYVSVMRYNVHDLLIAL